MTRRPLREGSNVRAREGQAVMRSHKLDEHAGDRRTTRPPQRPKPRVKPRETAPLVWVEGTLGLARAAGTAEVHIEVLIEVFVEVDPAVGRLDQVRLKPPRRSLSEERDLLRSCSLSLSHYIGKERPC